MKIAVLGYIVRGPLGGMAWHHLQYVLGLRQMKHEVLFIEDSDDYPSCYHPLKFETTIDPTFGLDFIKALFKRFGLEHDWSYYDAHDKRWYGKSGESAKRFLQSADIVINLSGINPLRSWWQNVPARVLIDTDPVFFQIRMLNDETFNHLVKAHTHHFSFGENIGMAHCNIPTGNVNWLPTRQPVFLNAWKPGSYRAKANWTTVMQWDSYKEAEYKEEVYGMKRKSFMQLIDLPKRVVGENFELALGSDSAPRQLLKDKGWIVSDPYQATSTPEIFQEFISNSKGEWSIAKDGYVKSKSGWFSERSANYLASGKPVIVQDTGFADLLPTGTGLLCFNNIDEAIDCLHVVNNDYPLHCKRAREIAEAYFSSKIILNALLDRL